MTAGGQYTFAYNANGDMTAVYNIGTLNWSYAFDMEDRQRRSVELLHPERAKLSVAGVDDEAGAVAADAPEVELAGELGARDELTLWIEEIERPDGAPGRLLKS